MFINHYDSKAIDEVYRVSQIRWFYGVSPKVTKVEQCSFRKRVFDFCEKMSDGGHNFHSSPFSERLCDLNLLLRY